MYFAFTVRHFQLSTHTEKKKARYKNIHMLFCLVSYLGSEKIEEP